MPLFDVKALFNILGRHLVDHFKLEAGLLFAQYETLPMEGAAIAKTKTKRG